jgi:DNA-binding NtrC family response regulator
VTLPGDGSLVIGRAETADVTLEDSSVSRRHVSIDVRGEEVVATDLGSRNGTLINGSRIHGSAPLRSGAVMGVGSALLVYRAKRSRELPRLHDASELRGRLAAEVDRSARHLHPLSLVVIDVGRGPGGSEAARTAVAEACRSMDVVGRLDERTLAVILPDVDSTGVGAAAGRLMAVARALSGDTRAGAASWARDACDADTMIAAARAALGSAAAGELRTAEQAIVELDAGSVRVQFADPAMLDAIVVIERIAPTELAVLLTGETGVGKEVLATVLHHLSPRRDGPFVALNCAALPESLAESELFGHVRGAFTGAQQDRKGKLAQADGGTLLLDEIGDMPLTLQAKLLRAVEEKRISRLGSEGAVSIDVRIVAATNRKLEEEVAAGRFRRDLYYRLSAATVDIPPLRQRPREIPILARTIVEHAARAQGKLAQRIAPATMHVLATHAWPGNIRELRNVLEYAVAVATGDAIEPHMLPPGLVGSAEEQPAPDAAALSARQPAPVSDEPSRPLPEQLQEFEARQLREALERAGGVKKDAAALLGVPLRTFHTKLRRYGLT